MVEMWLTASCPPGASPSTVIYQTNWSGGSLSSTASQVIQIIDGTGGVVRSDSINRSGQSSSEINISNIPAGVYEVRARLFSQPNAGGTEIGVAKAIVDLCAGGSGGVVRTVNTVTSATVNRVEIFPDDIERAQQQSARFVAMAMSSSNQSVFVDLDAYTWTALGGIGTVSDEGVFTATTAGNGQVRAALDGTAFAASAAVEVTPFNVVQKKWTIMVFINAANDLYYASDLNMNQMEEVAGNDDVRFVVQWKQSRDVFPASSFDGVRRYLVKPDNTSEIKSELVQANLTNGSGMALDMGDPDTLNDFITWAKTYYPADRYALVLWNHGNGWRRSPQDEATRAFSYDDQYGTSIKTWQTDEALMGHTFDIIAWDASLMQMMEVAYEARDYADFIVGSEESPPADGYPYDDVFRPFRDNPDASTSNLTKAFVDGMLNHPPYATRKITQSSIDTSELGNVATALSALADQLIIHKDDPNLISAVQAARNQAQAYSQTSTRYYRDIIDLCEILESQPNVPGSVVTASANVRQAVSNAIVWEGHNNQSANSHGLSVDFSPGNIFLPVRPDYIQLKFAIDTNWDEWLGLSP